MNVNSLNELTKKMGKAKINSPKSSNSLNSLANMFSKAKIGVTKRVTKERLRVPIKSKKRRVNTLVKKYTSKTAKHKTRKNSPSNDKRIKELVSLYTK
jgi:hypothetical protein